MQLFAGTGAVIEKQVPNFYTGTYHTAQPTVTKHLIHLPNIYSVDISPKILKQIFVILWWWPGESYILVF